MTSKKSLMTLQNLFQTHRWTILLTYTLTLLENIFELLYPLVIGIAIDGLLTRNYISLLPLTGTWLAHTITEVARLMYDTRTFSGIYANLATTVVLEQGRQGVPASQVIARAGLSREFVDFFERDIPLTITATISFLGAIVMLFFYDWQIGMYCLFLLIPVTVVNHRYGRSALRFNQGLNDQLEQEVDILTQMQPAEICTHYQALLKWRVRISDAEAKNWGITTALLGGLVVAVLIRAIGLPNVKAGDIYTIVTYAMNFTFSLDDVPFLVQQLSRLKDIGNRVKIQIQEA